MFHGSIVVVDPAIMYTRHVGDVRRKGHLVQRRAIPFMLPSNTTVEERNCCGCECHTTTQLPGVPGYLPSSFGDYSVLAKPSSYAIAEAAEYRTVELYMYLGSEVRRHRFEKNCPRASHSTKSKLLNDSGDRLSLSVHESPYQTRSTLGAASNIGVSPK